MTQLSLSDITYEQGLQLIAARQEAIRQGKLQPLSKQAMAGMGTLQAVGAVLQEKRAYPFLEKLRQVGSSITSGLNSGIQSVTNTWKGLSAPTRDVLTKGLLGAGIGAVGGTGAAVLRGDPRWGRSAVMGGLAGGATGLGYGLLTNPDIPDVLKRQWDRWTGNGTATSDATSDAASDATSAAASAAAAGLKPKVPNSPDGMRPPAWFDSATPEQLDAEAKRLTDLPLDKAVDAVTDIETMQQANQALPHAAGAAAVTGGTGLGVAKIRNMEAYHPRELARELLQPVRPDKAGNIPKTNSRLDTVRAAVRSARRADVPKTLMDSLYAAANGQPMPRPPADVYARTVLKVYGNPTIPRVSLDRVLQQELMKLGYLPDNLTRDEAVKMLADMLDETSEFGRGLLGGPKSRGSVLRLLGGKGEDAIEKRVLATGFKGRPGRQAAALALLAGGATGLKMLYDSYRNSTQRQVQMKKLLNRLQSFADVKN